MVVKRGGRGPFHSCRVSGHPGDGPGSSAPTTVGGLTDNFNDNSQNTTLWTTGNFFDGAGTTAGTVVEQNSRLEVKGVTNTATHGYTGYISATTLDFTGQAASVNVSGIAGGANGNQTYLAIGSASNRGYYIYVDGSNGIIFAKQTTNGVWSTIATIGVYSATTHAWWRLRESGGTIFADTATSSASNPPVAGDWTNRSSEVINTTAIPNKTAVKVAIGSGTNTSLATTSTAIFDGFNTGT